MRSRARFLARESGETVGVTGGWSATGADVPADGTSPSPRAGFSAASCRRGSRRQAKPGHRTRPRPLQREARFERVFPDPRQHQPLRIRALGHQGVSPRARRGAIVAPLR